MDHINNWKILGIAWKTLGVDKPLLVERLTKAKIQDIFEFFPRFFKFFNANYVDDGEEYDAFAARGGEPQPAGAKGSAPTRLATARAKSTSTTLQSSTNTAQRPVPPTQAKKKLPTPPLSLGRSLAPDSSALKALEEENAKLNQQPEEVTSLAETVEDKPNFYFEKLQRIDRCNACVEGD